MVKAISRMLKYGTLLSTIGLIFSVLLQIFARFFLPNTPAWTEEASRLFFIYATAFSAGLALKNKYYVHLDLFFEQFPMRIKNILLILIPSFTLALFLIISFASIEFIWLGHLERSPSMKVRMSLAFFSIFIMGASLSFYAVLDLKKALKKKNS